MESKWTHAMLRILRINVEQELDSLKDARKFVRSTRRQISEPDRLFLMSALRSRTRLNASCSLRRKRALH
jgi:hypothetical protein